VPRFGALHDRSAPRGYDGRAYGGGPGWFLSAEVFRAIERPVEATWRRGHSWSLTSAAWHSR